MLKHSLYLGSYICVCKSVGYVNMILNRQLMIKILLEDSMKVSTLPRAEH
jgi:hypothetical protein